MKVKASMNFLTRLIQKIQEAQGKLEGGSKCLFHKQYSEEKDFFNLSNSN